MDCLYSIIYSVLYLEVFDQYLPFELKKNMRGVHPVVIAPQNDFP